MVNSISHFDNLGSTSTGYEAITDLPEFPFMYKIVEYDGLKVPNHWHESLEIIYIEFGHMRVDLQGAITDLYGQDFIIINSKDIHSTQALTNTRSCVLQLPPEFMRTVTQDFDDIRFENQAIQSSGIRGNETTDRIRSDLSLMSNIYEHKNDGYVCAFLSLLYDMLFLLNTKTKITISPGQRTKTERNRQILSEVTTFVRNNYKRHITLKEAAATAGLQQEYFCRFFKRNMGMSFIDYVNEVRFSKVYEDLMSTDLSVQDILERRGFTNYKLFARMFRERYKTTPTKKRRQSS